MAAKKGTATLLEPFTEPGEAWEATSVTVPEELAAVRARRGRTTEARKNRWPGEAESPFRHASTLGPEGRLELLVVQAKIGQAVALPGTCPLCQVEGRRHPKGCSLVTNRVGSKRVRKISRKGRATVCLYWFHPLLLAESQRLLPSGDFRLMSRRLEPDPVPDLRSPPQPRASLYLVESHPRGLVTEAIVAAVAELASGARVLVIAESFREENAFRLLRLGVKGLLRYSELPTQLSRALGVVAGGGFWVPRGLLSKFLDTMGSAPLPARPMAGASHLTGREREVLECLLQNLLNKEIAKKLRISERTAKFHVSNLLAKFGVQRRADLILLRFTQPQDPERS